LTSPALSLFRFHPTSDFFSQDPHAVLVSSALGVTEGCEQIPVAQGAGCECLVKFSGGLISVCQCHVSHSHFRFLVLWVVVLRWLFASLPFIVPLSVCL
jgi:hypothetical protein